MEIQNLLNPNYECLSCDRAFNSRPELRRHVKLIHSRLDGCPFCHEQIKGTLSTRNKDNLRMHFYMCSGYRTKYDIRDKQLMERTIQVILKRPVKKLDQ